jgi:hypothetical protein
MNDLLKAARDLQVFCDSRGWKSCVIGGLAVQRWGEPRVTRDVDVTLLAGFGSELDFIQVLLARYPARLAQPVDFALRNRVLLLQTTEGIGLDVSLGALPFEELAIRRASDFNFSPGLSIRTCSAEDLLVLKLFASRPMDVRDAETVALRQHGQLEWDYVEEQLRPLAEFKDDAAILETLMRLRKL